MSFPRTHRAIKAMILGAALQSRMARAIVRKSGVMGGVGGVGGAGTTVLSADIFPDGRDIDLGAGFVWRHSGFLNIFSLWVQPERYDWWPHNFSSGMGLHTSATDLSRASTIRNQWYVVPGYANPNVNIRVQASLDGLEWGSITDDEADDWRFAGANVNAGGWLTYTEGGVPYENYPPTYPDREGVTNALPGGIITSGWRQVKQEYRAEEVYLRWIMEWSTTFDPDPIYTVFEVLGLGYGEVRAR